MREPACAQWIIACALVLVSGLAISLGAFGRRAGWVRPLGFGAAIGPGVIVLAGLGSIVFHVHATVAVAACVGCALATGAALARARRHVPRPESASRPERGWLLFALCVTALCAAYPALSQWWRISSDAWTHEGIVRAIRRDGLPPGDPWYAGLTLHYDWLYHVAVAELQSVTGADLFALMAMLAVVSAGAMALCAADLARAFDSRHVLASLCLLFFGMNAVFPLLTPLIVAHGFFGHDPGWAKVGRLLSLCPFGWDRVGAFLRSFGAQDFFLNKFLVATPLSLALAAFTAWLVTLAEVLRRPVPPGTLVVAALCAATATGLHPVVGLDLAALLGVVLLAGLVLLPIPGQRARVMRWVVASAIGFAPAAWFIAVSVRSTGGAHAALPLGLHPWKLAGIVGSCALGLWFAAWRRAAHGPAEPDEEARGARHIWLAVVAGALLVALLIRLPGPGDFFTVDKFSYLVWIPLALVAGPAFGDFLRRRSRVGRVAIALALFLPVNGLALVSRALDPNVAVRQPWDRPAFRWMREHLPANAVLMTPRGDIDLSVFAQRDQFYGLDVDAELRGLPEQEIETRRAALVDVFERGRVDAAAIRACTRGRPCYVVRPNYRAPFWRSTPGAWSKRETPSSSDAGWLAVYADSDLTVTPLSAITSRRGEP